MKHRISSLCVLTIATAGIAVLGSVCEGSNDGDPFSGKVSVELQNYSDQYVHMIGPGETFGKDNELWPFDADPDTLEDKRFIFVNQGNLAVTIRAMTEGNSPLEVTCELPGNDLNNAEFLTVIYTSFPIQVLTCVLQ